MENMTDSFVKIQSTAKSRVMKYKKKLQQMGLSEESSSVFSGQISNSQLKKLKRFSEKHNLKLVVNEGYSSRSNDYRNVYLKENRKEKYRCVYCGRKYPKDKITIDHLYPIAKVSKSIRLQNKMRKMGINNVNDASNLVPACFSCNRKKSDKLGLWILKGRVGKYEWLWKIRWGLRIFLLGFCLFLIITFVMEYFLKLQIMTDIFALFH